jgi:hypothetical protein
MDVLVAGATGFIGKALVRALRRRGDGVVAVARDPARASLAPDVEVIPWEDAGLRDAAGRVDAVINLAGESVGGKRWTPAYKERLRSSRVDTTRRLVDAMAAAGRPGQTLLNGSAAGYYGDRGDETITEASRPGVDFLAQLCIDWEGEALKAEARGTRVVLLRTGIVLGEGGTLEKMLPIFRLGLGGPLGSGQQFVPWIHMADEIGLILFALDRPEVRGPLNLTAPAPVTMRAFAKTLGQVLGRPAVLPAPGFALKLVLGEFAHVVLGGQKAVPEVALRHGYEFVYPHLEPALRETLGR